MIDYPNRQDGVIMTTQNYSLGLDSVSVHKHAGKRTSITHLYLNSLNAKSVFENVLVLR